MARADRSTFINALQGNGTRRLGVLRTERKFAHYPATPFLDVVSATAWCCGSTPTGRGGGGSVCPRSFHRLLPRNSNTFDGLSYPTRRLMEPRVPDLLVKLERARVCVAGELGDDRAVFARFDRNREIPMAQRVKREPGVEAELVAKPIPPNAERSCSSTVRRDCSKTEPHRVVGFQRWRGKSPPTYRWEVQRPSASPSARPPCGDAGPIESGRGRIRRL